MCCSDKLHCCPEGYRCNLTAETCDSDGHSVSWNVAAVRDVDKSSPNDVQCPDGEESCPDGDTCCQLQSGDYGCCPYPQVVLQVTEVRQISSFLGCTGVLRT